MAQHNETGKQGELIAQQYLKNKGYQLLKTNWRYRYEEVDIICENQNTLVFVEVKTRSSNVHGDPTDAITPSKMRHLIAAAEQYITDRNIEKEARFDVITVILSSPVNIDHIEDAFGPEF